MTTLFVGVRHEGAGRDRRVAVVPSDVGRLASTGMAVLVEADAGARAWFDNSMYADCGAEIVSADELYRRADVVLSVGRPAIDRLRPGQLVIGMLAPLLDPEYAASLAARGVTAFSLDGIPRTLARAQAMDALTSQANVAGYKAALVAADAFERFFPMLITAAGTARPAKVLVLGCGVAGLQAIGTARRLGAVVRGYDVRSAARGEVESLGASFVELPSARDATGVGGYARALTEDEQQAQHEELGQQVARHDVVITTAQLPGRPPPLLVTEDALKAMRPGSVVVDLAASEYGGNVALAEPGRTIVTDNGVTVIGADNLPAAMPAAASAAYSRNITAMLRYLAPNGSLVIDPADAIVTGTLVTTGGALVHPGVVTLLEARTP